MTGGETLGLYTASRIGETHLGDHYRFSIGGTESNVAIGLSRLGTPSVWMGRVGDDDAGRVIVRTLRGEGVDARVTIDGSAPTAIMTRGRRLPGRSHVTYFRSGSAGAGLNPTDIPVGLVSSAALVHVTGVTPALSDTAAATVAHLVKLANEASVPVSFDINYRSRLWSIDRAVPVLRELASHADIVLAGQDEAQLVTGQLDLAAQLDALTALGPTQVVLKRGAAGAIARVDGVDVEAPGIPVDAIDTVGAGDAFAAGYLHALLSGAAPRERLQLANRVAAFVCSAEGDWEGLPLPHELPLLDSAEPVIR
ncbi:sugar kinase [Agromyces binzhouensis]|uniref:sugar kinase n=1 Tax=Agromyces binzhouensis TaxID=1817495 RepID=UPI00363AF1F8